MTVVQAGLSAQLAIAGLAVLVSFLAPERSRSRLAGGAAAALGIAGAVTGAAAMSGSGAARGLRVPIALPLQAPLDPLLLAPDELGGVFMLVAGSVVAITAVYGIGYASGPAASRSGWAAFAVFALGMQLVPAAADVVSFLLAWELMAVGSTILVLADHRLRASVVPATLSYAVMTHLSFLLLLGGFSVLVSVAGGTSFAALAGAGVTGRCGQRRLRAPAGRVRHQGGPGAAARLASAGAPGGPEPRLGGDERRDGEDGRVRGAAGPVPPSARRAELVGGAAAGARPGVRASTGSCRHL